MSLAVKRARGEEEDRNKNNDDDNDNNNNAAATAGAGRGRKNNLPAWMTQQRQSTQEETAVKVRSSEERKTRFGAS